MSPASPSLDPLGLALAASTKGEFSILGALGRGGMASVYLAKDRGLDRLVALKVLLPELLAVNPAAADRFALEARTAAGLAHPHIVPIYTVRQSESLHWFAMGFVDGWPLDAVIRDRGPLPAGAVRTILAQTASAVAFAHRKGIVHRDIKPGNVMVDTEGRAIVLDFGIAKVADQQGLTQTGASIGTPTYMSPEQCRGQDATSASDQYALGTVAYELLTGHPVFFSENTFGLIYQHVHELPKPLLDVVAGCPSELASAIMRMLAKDPAERWPSLAALAEALGTPRASDEAQLRDFVVREAPVSRLTLADEVPLRVSAVVPAAPATADVHTHELEGLMSGLLDGQPAAAMVQGFRAFFGGAATAPSAAQVAEDPTVRPTVVPAAVAEPEVEAPAAVLPAPPPMAVAPMPSVVAGVTLAATDTQTQELQLVEVHLELAPRRSTLTVGQTFPLTALLAKPIPKGHLVEWLSEDVTVVRVAPDGTATAEGIGTTTVIVRDAIGEARAKLEVTRVEVARVRLTSPSPSLSVGDAMTLVATVHDRLNARLDHRFIEWRTSDPRIATITPTGVLTGRSPGTVTVLVSCGGVRSDLDLLVGPERLTGVLVLPRTLAMQIGGDAKLQALPLTARGQSRSARPVSWSTTNPSVVQVFDDGTVIAVGKGMARITAVIEGWRGYVPVDVRAPGER
jgi:serine/threonine-protein kinase